MASPIIRLKLLGYQHGSAAESLKVGAGESARFAHRELRNGSMPKITTGVRNLLNELSVAAKVPSGALPALKTCLLAISNPRTTRHSDAMRQ